MPHPLRTSINIPHLSQRSAKVIKTKFAKNLLHIPWNNFRETRILINVLFMIEASLFVQPPKGRLRFIIAVWCRLSIEDSKRWINFNCKFSFFIYSSILDKTSWKLSSLESFLLLSLLFVRHLLICIYLYSDVFPMVSVLWMRNAKGQSVTTFW